MGLLPQLLFILGFLASLLPTCLAKGKAAPATSGNPQGAQYIAVLPSNTPISGSVVASSSPNGTGIEIEVSISGLPASGGPFCTWNSSYASICPSLT